MAQPEPVFFDSLAAASQLTEAGLAETAAKAVVNLHVDLFNRNVATRADIEKIQAEIEKLRAESDANSKRHSEDIEKIQAETENLRAAMSTLEIRLIKWIAGVGATAFSLLAGLIVILFDLLSAA